MFAPCPIRVLVADNNPLATSCLRARLSVLGYLVVGEAADGYEILSLARVQFPDVIVIAVDLPGMDGVEVSQEIDREQLCPVILLAGHGHAGQMQTASSLPAMQACLTKPVPEQVLEAAVARAASSFR